MSQYPHLDISELHATLSKYDESKSIVISVSAEDARLLYISNYADEDDAYARIYKLFEPDGEDTLEEFPIELPIVKPLDFFPLVMRLLSNPAVADDILASYIHQIRSQYWGAKEDEAKEQPDVKARVMLWEAELLHDYYLMKLTEPQPDKHNEYIGKAVYWHGAIQDIQNQKVKHIGTESFPPVLPN